MLDEGDVWGLMSRFCDDNGQRLRKLLRGHA